MNSYRFNIYPFGCESCQDCIVHFMDGSYHVLIEGNFAGSLVRDDDSPFGYRTGDDGLLPHIEEIAKNLWGVKERDRFPQILKAEWDVVVRTVFVDDEFLLVFVRPETDLSEFKIAVWEKIYTLVKFDQRLKIIIGKANSDEAIQIQIN